MPKLPSNLVKPPVFDNPLRRTTPMDVTATVERGQVIPIGTTVSIDASTNAGSSDSLDTNSDESRSPPRITIRIDDAIRRALETECFKRRVAGEKTNVAEIARGVLADWANH